MNYINPNAPAAGLTRLLNMRDNNPSTQLAYVPTKDIATMGSMGGLEFNPYSGIPQARGIAAVAEGGSINEAPLSPVADELASRGRYGDSMLLHVRPDELQGLASLGTLTINPDTGLPEAFSFKTLLPAIGSIAAVALLGPAGLGIAQGALGTGIAAGLGGFAGGLAAGQGVGQAALGGLMSGATAGFMAGAPTGVDPVGGAGAGFSEGAMSGANELGVEAAMTGVGEAVPITAASSAIPSSTAAIGSSIDPFGGIGLPPSAIDPFGGTGLPQVPAINPVAQTLGSNYTTAAPLASTGAEASFSESLAKEGLGQYLPKGSIGSAEKFARINPKTYEAPSKLKQALGAEDFTGREYITRQEYIDVGGRPADMKPGEFLEATFTDPKTYIGAGITTLMQPPPEMEYQEPEPLTFSSYTPRERTLAGGVQSPARSSEEYLRMALEGGYQPLSEQYRYAAQGGLVGLVEGGTPEQGALQSQLSPAVQQPSAPPPVLQQQEQQISERARQDELLQRDQAISRGQQFIEQPTGNQQLFQQMQSAGQVIGQQLAQGPQAYATPAGSKAPSTSFSTGADFGFNAGGLVGLAEGGIVSLRRGGEPNQIENVLPVTLQSTMKRLGIKNADPFLEFAQKTKQIESSGGINRINPDSSARGDFQWLTKVDPKAKKGEHGSVKTAVNRTITSYKRMGQEIPQWLKTLNKNSTKSTKDLEENVLSLTPDQELELFFGNMGEAEGSDVYLTEIAKGNQQAMFGAYSDIHHTRGREDKPTKEKAVKVFFSETAPQVDRSSAPNLLEENMVDTRSNELYTVQPGDTLSKLAAKSGMTIEDLMSSNLSRISDPDKIYAGQQIALSDSSDIPNPVPVSEGDEDGLMNIIKNLMPDFITRRAEGGEIGKYFEGQVVGNGDGMSDQILFEVEGNNPDKALLSRDEYVIPADVVAMLGNGSSNAGSEQLDGFIKGIRQDSFGTQKQQQQLNAQQGLRGLV